MTTYTQIDINNLLTEQFNLNFILSLGEACRPADALNRNNLRYFSSPFDWMMNYDLDTIYNFFLID